MRSSGGVPPQRCRFLGIEIDALDTDGLNHIIARAIESDRQIVIANHNLHSVHLQRRDGQLRKFFASADVVHIDGMPLVWLGRSLGWPLVPAYRTTYVDWFPQLIRLAAERGWRIFYLGGKPGVAERGLVLLRQRHPTLQARAAHGYLDQAAGASTEGVIAAISAYRPHLLFVGMGMPTQELWVAQNRHRLQANVVLTSGAAIDYVAGVIPTPPRWLGKLGLEWMFRLVAEPRRLGHRYLVEPWSLLVPYVGELAKRAFGGSANPR